MYLSYVCVLPPVPSKMGHGVQPDLASTGGVNWLIGDRLVISHVRILEQSTRRLAITHLIGLLTPEL